MATIDAAGELRIPFTSGILVGIGETRGRAGRLARGARRLARAPRAHPGGDPPELRAAPPVLRARGRGDRGCGGASALGSGPTAPRFASGDERARAMPLPDWATPDHARGHEAPGSRDPAADARRRHPDPAEPRRLVGRAGRRGRDRPRRPLGERRPHLARARVPEPARGPQAPRAAGLRADRAPLRLSAVPGAGLDRAGRARRRQAQVLELHPAQWVGAPRGAVDRPGAGARRDREGRPRARRSPRTS